MKKLYGIKQKVQKIKGEKKAEMPINKGDNWNMGFIPKLKLIVIYYHFTTILNLI